ncbi:MAG: hypothetical protein ACJAWL_002047 [Motiliproteus sp.]|jgi:hypothetical protein
MLIQQTGKDEASRQAFLQDCYSRAKAILIHTWEPEAEDDPTF